MEQSAVYGFYGLVEGSFSYLERGESLCHLFGFDSHLLILIFFFLLYVSIVIFPTQWDGLSFGQRGDVFPIDRNLILPECPRLQFGVILMSTQEISRQCLKILLQFYPRIPPGMIHLLSIGLILFFDDLFKHGRRVGFYFFLFEDDMVERFIFAEVGDGVPDIPNTVDLVDGSDVLGCNFVDGVGTVGLIPFVMSLLLVEAKLTRLAELIRIMRTSLRLLLRVQLSKPRLESGSLILGGSLR